MAVIREPRADTSAAEMAERIVFARAKDRPLGETIFLIGAGCSISAGVPGAADIAKHMVRDVAARLNCAPADPNDATACYSALLDANL